MTLFGAVLKETSWKVLISLRISTFGCSATVCDAPASIEPNPCGLHIDNAAARCSSGESNLKALSANKAITLTTDECGYFANIALNQPLSCDVKRSGRDNLFTNSFLSILTTFSIEIGRAKVLFFFEMKKKEFIFIFLHTY